MVASVTRKIKVILLGIGWVVLFTQTSFGQGSAETFYRKGRQVALLKKFDLALDFYGKAIEQNPAYFEAYRDRGAVELELARYKQAEADFTKALTLRADSSLYNMRAICYQQMGKSKRALRDLQNAVAWGDDSVNYHINQATVALSVSKYSLALAGYKRAIDLNPQNRFAYFGYGNTLTRLQAYEDALFFYDKALTINGYDANVHFNKGYALHELGRHPEAILEFTRAISLNKRYARAYYLRGVSWHLISENKKGCQDLKKALSLGETDSKKALGKYCR